MKPIHYMVIEQMRRALVSGLEALIGFGRRKLGRGSVLRSFFSAHFFTETRDDPEFRSGGVVFETRGIRSSAAQCLPMP